MYRIESKVQTSAVAYQENHAHQTEAVARFRERLAEVDEEFRYVVTVRGHGFRLENR